MNAALKLCQANFDAQLPPAVSESDEDREWLESAAEQLVCGSDVEWKRRRGPVRRVTSAQYAEHLQHHLNQRQIDGLDDRDSFANLVLAVVVGSPAEALTHAKHLLGTDSPVTELEAIAADLLRPHAADAVAAEREAAEDDAL
ncbi:hypothetical protein SAMN05216496_2402 [Pseudomonas sp. Z003-0.4C(8344-21)]|uniref:hypothetical protein n=1 Tax=Pseudomonas sp. Z003-0.4C(8344-21) TaxID=1855380 RepID=UPI00087AF0C9|nr:hypothetical protein [Pseudomonas sp. Z003-0.4C(8344-21)]SDS77943.1 hypothetical protein SAMN05216496_2402 [Pseudomonas sp. Z003-0.4C(8344-21)]